MAQVRLNIDSAALRREVQSNGGTLGRAANKAGRRIVARAKRNAPVDSGRLRQSISYEVTSRAGDVIIRVKANVEHAIYVHQGTGLGKRSPIVLAGGDARGPSGNLIVPKRRKALRWEAGAGTPAGIATGDGFVFSKSSKGQDADPFLAKAVRDTTVADFL